MLRLLTPAFLLEDSPRAGAFIVYVVVVYQPVDEVGTGRKRPGLIL